MGDILRSRRKESKTVPCPEDDPGVMEVGEEELISKYRHITSIKILFIVACILITVAISGVSMTIGSYDIGFWESYGIVIDHLLNGSDGSMKDFVIFDIRLPRICTGIVAGAGLALCGVVMQSTMKNPLADPYTTGISSGASFGATLAMVAGLTIIGGNYSIVINAFIFALIPMFLIMTISSVRRASSTMIILCGIAVMYIFNAMTTVLMLLANPDDLAAVYSWQVGSLESTSWESLTVMLIFVLSGSVILNSLAHKINVLSAGDESARSLGVNADHLRLLCLLIVSLVAASIVSFTGIIGFVGLVCPHMCRMIMGSDNRYLMPASMATGAALLVACDLIGRTIIAPTILNVGVITAFIGGPLFLYLLIKKKKEVW